MRDCAQSIILPVIPSAASYVIAGNIITKVLTA